MFCGTKAEADHQASQLGATAYYAGLPPAEKTEIAKRFQNGDEKIRILCYTSAFGTGIQNLNIRACFHVGKLRSFREYY